MRPTFILLFLQLWGNVTVSLSQNVCSEPPIVAHAHIAEDTRSEEYPQGHTIHFTCETGYISGPTIRYVCTNTGWTPIHEGKCYLKPCELPDDTPGGYYEMIKGQDFVFGAVIKYFCNTGYQMMSKEDTRTCLLNGWTNHVPICQPLSCDPPLEHGRITVVGLPDNQGAILPDRLLRFSCNEPGTFLNGSSVLICGYNGEWDHPIPTCEDITCTMGELHPALNVAGLPSANEKIKIGHKLQFQCDEGYSLRGPQELKCLQSGLWDKAFPTCTDQCKVIGVQRGVRIIPPLPRNNQVSQGEIIQFGCLNRQDFLQGNATVECLANGQWSDRFPTCGPPVGCGKPPGLENGDTISTTGLRYNHDDRVEYVCQQKYIIKGSSFKTCKNGQWTGQMTCLRPCTVTSELMNTRNIRFKYSRAERLHASHNEGLTFACTGRTKAVNPLNMSQVCKDGVMDLPRCV